MTKIAIFHPSDPLGQVPSGIDTFLKGILTWAPDDLDYTLFGATSDPVKHPIGRAMSVTMGKRPFKLIPIVSASPSATRGRVPLTARYMWALKRIIALGGCATFDVLDFQRIEPVLLFRHDTRPKNLILHQDYADLRHPNSDIMWRHWPWLYDRLEARVFGKVDRVFAVRRSAVERYKKSYPRLAKKFVFTPTWVDFDTFHPIPDASDRHQLRARLLETLRAPSDSRLLVFVGRLDRQKNPSLLLEAFRQASGRRDGLHLIVIGDGILRPEVQATCSGAELIGRVHLLGVRSAHQIAEFLQVSDLFVLSSAYEGMPIAVLEALATGLPVVSTDVGEVGAIVRSGINGRISKDQSATSLADSICSALDEVELTQGEPCVASVAPYQPQPVLSQIYNNHRRQGQMTGQQVSA
jgi:glycosyltransferase involved in cell wall biosynthesis